MSYAELHAKTNFSFLEGASHPDELVDRAAELGYAALAVTDRNSLAGVVRAHQAAKEAGLKLLVGAEITPEDAPPVVLWATDRAAYGRLARLITLGRRRAEKGQCRLTLDDVAGHAAGLAGGGCCGRRRRRRKRGTMSLSRPFRPSASPPSRRIAKLSATAAICWPNCTAGRTTSSGWIGSLELSRRSGVPLAAAGDVHYHVPQRQALCDVLTAIRHGCTVAAAGERLFPNAQRHLHSPAGDGRAVRPLPGGARAARWKSPSVARFRSTSCVTSIPRSWPRRARRRSSIWPGWLGRGRRSAIRRACPSGCGG